MKRDKYLIELGNNLRAERNRLKLSQEELAEKCGLLRQHISDIENAKTDIRFSTLIEILTGLDLPFEKLFELKK